MQRFVLLMLTVAACHEASPASVSPSTIATPPPSPSSGSAPPLASPTLPAATSVPDICATSATQNREALRGASVDSAEAPDAGLSELRKQLAEESRFGYCRRGHGTWSVHVSSAELSAPPGRGGSHAWGYRVSYELVFVASTGGASRLEAANAVPLRILEGGRHRGGAVRLRWRRSRRARRDR